MRRIWQSVLVTAALWLADPALAQDKLNCVDPQAQIEMNMCAWQDFEKADAELNAIWKDAMTAAKALDAEESNPNLKGAAKALLAGQRGWIAYRDGQCELAGWEAHGGSMEPMLESGCKAELTRERTSQLKAFISGPEQ
jgi:uncharacterized protein YecT (DUF1311 family)